MWDDFKAVYLLKSLILIPNPQNICRDLQGIQAKYMQTFIITNAAKTVEDLTTMEFPPDRLVNTISWANKRAFFLGKLVAVCCKYSFSRLGLAQNKY